MTIHFNVLWDLFERAGLLEIIETLLRSLEKTLISVSEIMNSYNLDRKGSSLKIVIMVVTERKLYKNTAQQWSSYLSRRRKSFSLLIRTSKNINDTLAITIHGVGKSIHIYPEEREQALEYCIEDELLSATDFRDVSAYLAQHRLEKIPKGIETTPSISSPSIQVSTRSISEYVKIMDSEINEWWSWRVITCLYCHKFFKGYFTRKSLQNL